MRPQATKDLYTYPHTHGQIAGLIRLEANAQEEREGSGAEQAPPPRARIKGLELELAVQWFLGDAKQNSSSVNRS